MTCKCKDNMRWLWHELFELRARAPAAEASSFLHQTIWNGSSAVCIMYVSVRRCSSQVQSPAAIQHSWFFSSPLHHYPFQLCWRNPRSLLHCLTFKMLGVKPAELTNERPQVDDDQPPPLCCTRCFCPWKPHWTRAGFKVFICSSNHQALHSTSQSALLESYLRG